MKRRNAHDEAPFLATNEHEHLNGIPPASTTPSSSTRLHRFWRRQRGHFSLRTGSRPRRLLLLVVLLGAVFLGHNWSWSTSSTSTIQRRTSSLRQNPSSSSSDRQLLLSDISCEEDYLNSRQLIDHIRVATATSSQSSSLSSVPSSRILCFLMTHEGSHATRVQSVLDTWGLRCDRLLIMSNVTDPTVGSIRLSTDASYKNLWNKLNETIQYIWKQYGDDGNNDNNEHFDFYLKADDDTFVIMENLRFFLASEAVRKMQYPQNDNSDLRHQPPKQQQRQQQQQQQQRQVPIIFGHPAQSDVWSRVWDFEGADRPGNVAFRNLFEQYVLHNQTTTTANFFAGGSGYVFNHAYLKEFVAALHSPNTIRDAYPPEDMAQTVTMMARGIDMNPYRSYDKLGRGRFLPEPPDLWSFIHSQRVQKGEKLVSAKQACTTFCVSMHHITPRHMRYLWDQLYNCR